MAACVPFGCSRHWERVRLEPKTSFEMFGLTSNSSGRDFSLSCLPQQPGEIVHTLGIIHVRFARALSYHLPMLLVSRTNLATQIVLRKGRLLARAAYTQGHPLYISGIVATTSTCNSILCIMYLAPRLGWLLTRIILNAAAVFPPY